jgi:hypothetical protein
VVSFWSVSCIESGRLWLRASKYQHKVALQVNLASICVLFGRKVLPCELAEFDECEQAPIGARGPNLDTLGAIVLGKCPARHSFLSVNARIGPSLDIGVFAFEAVATGEAVYYPFFPCNPIATHPAQQRSEYAAGASVEICIGISRRLRACGNIFRGDFFRAIQEK